MRQDSRLAVQLKLPHLFLDDLRRALLPVPVKIAKCSDDFHAVDPSCNPPTKWPGATVVAPGLSFARSAGGFVILRCLIPRFDGAILSLEWKEAVWDRYVMGAPRPRTPSEQQYSDRKLRSRR
ncbi:hypothetical protein SPKIRA_33490 [Sphingomonas paucimobilis]|nr:hypothetical protein SPKIRA_33490 [Sphingomonas paucimobilis]